MRFARAFVVRRQQCDGADVIWANSRVIRSRVSEVLMSKAIPMNYRPKVSAQIE